MARRKNKPPLALATTLVAGVIAVSVVWAAAPESGTSIPVRIPAPICEADYGGRMERLQPPPTTDVYERQSVTLGKRFRFSAQYLPERAKLKTWVHELRERGPALLHAAEYPLPADACAHSGTEGSADRSFGLNKVYSSDYERELFFQCRPGCD